MHPRTIKIFTARDTLEAHHVRNMLESAGIKAIVMGELLGVARGDLPMTQETLPSVWVNEPDVEAAMKVVHDWIGPGDRDPDEIPLATWQCPSCGEEIEGQFNACWKCGAARPPETG